MKEQITLGRMTKNDINEVLQISEECNLSRWSFEGYSSELSRTDSIQIVAKTSDYIIGFIVLRVISSIDEAEICNLGVRNNFQKKGIGKKLLETSLQLSNTKFVWLEVRESNHKAIEFYRKNNFYFVGQRKNFYTNPLENALVMMLGNIYKT